jgi:hypothetical protein
VLSALEERCEWNRWAYSAFPDEDLSTDELVLSVINRCGPDAVARVLSSVARVPLHSWVGGTRSEAEANTNKSTHTALLLVAKEAILSLLDERDSLGMQLSHANGDISEEALDELLTARAAKTCAIDPGTLAQKTARLAVLIKDRIDADVVATIFNCDLEQARTALREAPAALEKEHRDINKTLAALWPESDIR